MRTDPIFCLQKKKNLSVSVVVQDYENGSRIFLRNVVRVSAEPYHFKN